jgi:LCP family protein required for cell wall assembly
MSDEDPWKGWYQEKRPAGEAGADATHDMTVSSRMPPPGDAPGPGAPQGAWPQQPPSSSSGSPYGQAGSRGGYGGAGGYGGGGRTGAAPPNTPVRRGRRWRFWGQPGRHGRRIALIIAIVVIVILVAIGSTYFWVNGKLNRDVTLPATTNTSAGTNWLIAGDDSRTGLTRTQQDALHLGDEGADASDSLMLLHMGSGKPVLISIPRDSYVDIPGHGDDKINAALSIGGPPLLIQTVENLTGLKINHYMGIGFEGLASVVNNVGGVRICLPTALTDANSGVNLKAGCQNLNGTEAVAFARDRDSFATSDLQREQDQRAFLSALLSKATSPGVYLNPFVSLPFASAAASSISVDKSASLWDLLQAALALRDPETTTVPVANPSFETSAGDSVELDQSQALELFDAIKDGKTVPSSLISGTKIG